MPTTRRDLIKSGLAVSTLSVLPVRGLAALALPAPETRDHAVSREKFLFDFGWKFTLGNADDAKLDLKFGETQDEFAKAGNFKFAQPDFDDSKWRTLDLPHDWAIELPFVNDPSLKSHGYKPLGRRYPGNSVGWYRRTFNFPKEAFGKVVSIQFDGISRDTLVFLNGSYIGRHNDAYTSFGFDVSAYLNYGGANTLALRVDASYGDAWFYEGAGIYRHVWLVRHDQVHFGQWESWVRSAEADGTANLELGTEALNNSNRSEICSVTWDIADESGKVVAKASSDAATIAPGEQTFFTASAQFNQPRLWDIDEPYLYSASLSLKRGDAVLDIEHIHFGVRSIRFDPNRGFFLNGRSVKIKGTCNHQDHAGVGVAVPDDLQRFRLAKLREMHSNAVRTSHNMPTPEWVEACDREGMMMMCETRTMGATPEALSKLEVMVKRYRNSPSIIIWSMGNEEQELQKSEEGEHVVKAMVELCHRLDPTRTCTAAVNGSFETGVSKALDVEGFNYNLYKIAPYHAAHPERPLIGSETAHHTVSTRGLHFTDPETNLVGVSDIHHKYVLEQPDDWWTQYATNDYLPGGFIWTGFDYRGEPTPASWPSISSQFGVLDTCGYPKDHFFYYKAWWGEKPVVHAFPHWNWSGWEGRQIPVWVYANTDEVELLLNSKSLGTKVCKRYGHLVWDVSYESGVLEAHGKRDGKVVVVDRRETTGQPTSLKLTAEQVTDRADGEGLIIVRVEAQDEHGRFVPTANMSLYFSVSGAGHLLGVGNGDPNCLEADNKPQRSLFNGLAQVIVRVGMKAGTVTITADAKEDPRLAPAKLEIAVKAATTRPWVI